jgi:hypothetical protein
VNGGRAVCLRTVVVGINNPTFKIAVEKFHSHLKYFSFVRLANGLGGCLSRWE